MVDGMFMGTIATDLSFATRFAVHRLAWLYCRTTRRQTVNTDLRTRHGEHRQTWGGLKGGNGRDEDEWEVGKKAEEEMTGKIPKKWRKMRRSREPTGVWFDLVKVCI